MTITEKYINLIVPSLAAAEGSTVETKPMNGGTAYMFACPFCSHLVTSTGKSKLKKRTAILMPRKESKWVYTFKCHRAFAPECRGGPRSFRNFLLMYDQSLAYKYIRELNHNHYDRNSNLTREKKF